MMSAMMADLLDSVSARAIAVALVCHASCAIVGCYLVLRRMSLMGDALSHAVLPGLVIAFVVSGSQGAVPMFLGALGAGLVTTFLTQTVERYGRIAPDASLGVVYTALFALGVLLVKRYVSEIHFDVACVYEGSLLKVALDTVPWGSLEVPRALAPAVLVLVLTVGVVTLFWKELKLASFDPTLAASMGLAPRWMHYLLMLLVSLATVSSFEAIGSILVIAMLIAPPATARLLTNRLKPMLLLSVGVSIAATLLGYQSAVVLNVSPGGAIAVAAGGLYFAAALLSPTEGVLSRVLDNLRVAVRVRREDVLALLYRRHEGAPGATTPVSLALHTAGGGFVARRAVDSLVRRGEAVVEQDTLALTDAGRQAGAALVRSHRLWEAYLVDEVGIQPDHVHNAAHQVEHVLDEQIRNEITEQLGGVRTDPHGKEIPE